MKYFAIPLRNDGTERLGTLGVLSGEYGSEMNFIHFKLNKYAESGRIYHIYSYDNGRWSDVLKTWRKS